MQENYYKPIKLAENIFHIYEPGNVYTTLIIGEEKALLIDTGYGFGDLAGFVRTLTDKPLEVVLTHGHTDHCGGNSQFPIVYMNMMDVPTYLWYEATQKTLIVEKFKRDRAAAGLPDVWPEDFDQEKWSAQHTRHFEPLKNGQILILAEGKKKSSLCRDIPSDPLWFLIMKQDFFFPGTISVIVCGSCLIPVPDSQNTLST